MQARDRQACDKTDALLRVRDTKSKQLLDRLAAAEVRLADKGGHDHDNQWGAHADNLGDSFSTSAASGMGASAQGGRGAAAGGGSRVGRAGSMAAQDIEEEIERARRKWKEKKEK